MDESFARSPTQTKSFPGQFDSLAKVGKFVTQAATAAGFDQTAIYAVEMAVDEAYTNIIEHAYGGEERGDIECTCQVRPGELTVTLRDFGRPFDPDSVPEPNIHARLEERSEGGLGLFLMRKLMDEVHFEFTADAGNVLTLVKRKEKSA